MSMQKVSEVLSTIETNKKSMEFFKTGFTTLDEKLDGGFLRKELIVIGGRTGIGKSYIAAQLMLNIAKQGFKCAYFSLEISNEMVVSRLVGSIANIKSTRVRSGMLSLDELGQLNEAKGTLSAYEDYLCFYDNVYKLEEVKKEVADNAYDFVVIDFIGNIMALGSDEYSRLSLAALELQKLAKETNSCILVLSQLSNSVAREGSQGTTVEYKGSGNIATVCDLGFFIEREQTFNITGADSIKLNLKKNRRGLSNIYFDLIFRHPGGWIYEQAQS